MTQSSTQDSGDEEPADNNKLKAINYVQSQAQKSLDNLTGWSPQNGVQITSGLTGIWDSPVAETYSSSISSAVSSNDAVIGNIISVLSGAAAQQISYPGEKLKPGEHTVEEKWHAEP